MQSFSTQNPDAPSIPGAFSLMQGAPQLLAEEDKDREEQDGKHQGEHESQTPVARFVDVRSEPPSHDGVSNLGHPRLLSWRECRTSWSGTPFPKGSVEVVESEVGQHDITIQDVEPSFIRKFGDHLGSFFLVPRPQATCPRTNQSIAEVDVLGLSSGNCP